MILKNEKTKSFYDRFQELGLEKGWGDTAARTKETIHLLLDLLEAPDPSTLEKFLGTIPMVFNVVILSPHGYFAQANVLGYPDTGGQVRNLFFQLNSLTFSFSASFCCSFNMVSVFVGCVHFGSSACLGE